MAGDNRLRMGLTEWAMMLALSLLWGGSFLFVGIAVAELPPLSIVTARVGLAAGALWLFLALSGRRGPSGGAAWLACFGMGILNNAVPFTLIAWGQTQIASGLASILNAMTPIFTVLVAHVLTSDERLTPARTSGVALGFAGVVVMIGGAALEGLGTNIFSQLAILGAALSYGVSGVWGRRFRRLGLHPSATATGQVTCSAALLIPIALIVDRPWTMGLPGAEILASVVALALLSTALAYILFFRILQTAGATNLSLVTFLIPVSAILLGALVLDERLETRHFAGLALILAGLAAIDGRIAAWIARRRTARS